MTITLELPDEVYNAVRIEAERFGTTPEDRIQRMIEQTHRFRINHPDFDANAELERVTREQALDPERLLPYLRDVPKG